MIGLFAVASAADWEWVYTYPEGKAEAYIDRDSITKLNDKYKLA